MTRAARLALVLVVATVALGSRPSRAEEPAPSDSSLHRFLDTLADSTDRYFGLIAAPLDTAGLDSALAAGLGRPWFGPRGPSRLSLRPAYAFDRVDGTLWGGSVALRNPSALWHAGADLGYTSGSDTWLGGGELSVATRRRETTWALRLAGGRRTETMNRDVSERLIASVAALVSGGDRQNYLRRDGFTVAFGGNGTGWRAGLEYRDRLESPLIVTTRWNFARRALADDDNLRAAPGRAHEVAFGGSLRIPRLAIPGSAYPPDLRPRARQRFRLSPHPRSAGRRDRRGRPRLIRAPARLRAARRRPVAAGGILPRRLALAAEPAQRFTRWDRDGDRAPRRDRRG